MLLLYSVRRWDLTDRPCQVYFLWSETEFLPTTKSSAYPYEGSWTRFILRRCWPRYISILSSTEVCLLVPRRYGTTINFQPLKLSDNTVSRTDGVSSWTRSPCTLSNRMYTIGVDHDFGELQIWCGSLSRIYGYRTSATSLYAGECLLNLDVGLAQQICASA